MKVDNAFLVVTTARLLALLEDQEQLLEVIRDKQTKLVRVDGNRCIGSPAEGEIPGVVVYGCGRS